MSVGSVTPAAGSVGVAPAGSASAGGGLPAPAPLVAAFVEAAVEAPAAQLAVLAAAADPESLARLLVDLALAPEGALPAPAQATAAALAGAQGQLTEDVTPSALREAMQTSGLFLEAGLAKQVQNPRGAALDVGSDRKALLLRLLDDLAHGGEDRQIENLRRDAQGALAHVELSQEASIPRAGAPRLWSFEAPVATPQGPAVGRFEITRDGGGGSGAQGGEAASWRARFSLSLEPSGPVTADVSLSGGRTRVTLWAERADALAAFGSRQGELVDALAEAPGADVAVRVAQGPPPRPPARAGQLLDRRS